MKTVKRVLAFLAAMILFGLYLVTFLLAVFGNVNTNNWLMASLVMTVVVPVLFYAIFLVARILKNRNLKDDEQADS